MPTRLPAQKITIRLSRCNCGCKGRDPWHAEEFKRAIREVEERPGVEQIRAYGHEEEVDAVGVAQFPFGEERVARVILRAGDKTYRLGWYMVG